MLSASFSRKDVEEMATYANAPLIKKGDTVVFVLLGKRAAAVVLAEVKEVRSFCQKSAWLEDDAEDTIAYLAWNLAMA
jgi:ASC-1-like (ASCH) protein